MVPGLYELGRLAFSTKMSKNTQERFKIKAEERQSLETPRTTLLKSSVLQSHQHGIAQSNAKTVTWLCYVSDVTGQSYLVGSPPSFQRWHFESQL